MVGPELVRRYGPVIAPEGSSVAAMLERVEELQQEAGRRYLELQEKAAAALNG